MNCEAFETEVIENFLCLDQEDRRFYWNKLHNESFRMKPRQETDSISFEALLERFNVVNLEEEIMSDSVLSEILNHTRKEYLEIDGNLGLDEFYNIHEAFICYYQNKFFNELLIFIDKQYFDSSVSSNTIPLKTIEPIPHKKLKVNITVPQLTFLFKMLNDLKPDIFDITAKTELSNFIADNFITKATEKAGIKSGSVYNLFTDTDKSTAIFWSEKLVKMLQVARQV